MKINDLMQLLAKAQHPEDVFDGVVTAEDLKEKYREFAKVAHPDRNKTKKDRTTAEEAFKLLNRWHKVAEQKLKEGRYGDRTWMEPVKLATKKQTYTLTRRLPKGDIANVYAGTDDYPYAIKVCRSPANNDLLTNEAEILSYLWNEAKTKKLKAMAHVVKFHDSFELAAAGMRKRVVVTHLADGYFNLAEVKAAFPGGIDCRDAAWMFNRLLGALLITQQAGVVHNAVLPEHVLIHPGKHNAKLCDFSYATKGKVPAKAIVASRKDLYAPELLEKKPTTAATDIYMAAKTMLWLIDPKTLPRNVAGLLRSCLLAQRGRPQDPWEVFEDLGKELEAAFGPKKFREFVMPAHSAHVP